MFKRLREARGRRSNADPGLTEDQVYLALYGPETRSGLTKRSDSWGVWEWWFDEFHSVKV